MNYLKEFEGDAEVADHYLLKSVSQKTQQQIRLEEILKPLQLTPRAIADIACGAGGLSLHLSRIYPFASFTLLDLGDHAIRLARKVAAGFKSEVIQASCYDIPLSSSSMDLVFFWQTLSWIEYPRIALSELLRICRPGGRIFASALFNVDYDVDLTTVAKDYTRTPPAKLQYSVFSEKTIREWLGNQGDIVFNDFQMPIDLPKSGRGLGTHTVGAERLQISGGMLMNWKILEIVKGT